MTDSPAEPTVFERIVAREIPARIVAETDRVIAFHDIAPKAPVHVVVTTKTADYRDVVGLAAGDPALLAELVAVAQGVAAELGDGEFRLVFNTGASAGQTVFHVHAHVLAGALEEDTLAGA
ncbi:HIT domain-containing protein [Agromyces sp. NPDC058126]|uniref:HIT domain-containing protein n=1 Tax=Agromyces sp. NPDC058126 TaxID=3346350 RepID=UPI0036D789C3